MSIASRPCGRMRRSERLYFNRIQPQTHQAQKEALQYEAIKSKVRACTHRAAGSLELESAWSLLSGGGASRVATRGVAGGALHRTQHILHHAHRHAASPSHAACVERCEATLALNAVAWASGVRGACNAPLHTGGPCALLMFLRALVAARFAVSADGGS
eukprot:3261315-Prymnesium_polylepis.1